MKAADTDSTLFSILYQTEEGQYKSYFILDAWTPDEFGALASAIEPSRLKKILDHEVPGVDLKEEKKASRAVELTLQFIKYCKKMQEENFLEVEFLGDKLHLPCCRYIQWLAEENIRVTYRFLKHLPLNLLELFDLFSPTNKILRNSSIYLTPYHKALLQRRVEALLKRASPNKMRHQEILDSPSIKSLRRTFQKAPGICKPYRPRTLLSWIKEVNPECPKGGSTQKKKPKLTQARKK